MFRRRVCVDTSFEGEFRVVLKQRIILRFVNMSGNMWLAISRDLFLRKLNAAASSLDAVIHAYGGNFYGRKFKREVDFLPKVSPSCMSTRMVSSIREAHGCRWKMCNLGVLFSIKS